MTEERAAIYILPLGFVCVGPGGSRGAFRVRLPNQISEWGAFLVDVRLAQLLGWDRFLHVPHVSHTNGMFYFEAQTTFAPRQGNRRRVTSREHPLGTRTNVSPRGWDDKAVLFVGQGCCLLGSSSLVQK